MKYLLGIDVAKAKLDCALRLADGRIRHKVVDNTATGFEVLSAWLSKQNVVELHVCMEATGPYWEAVAEYLCDAGHRVSVVNPSQIKAFGAAALVRTKTDRVDARLIAEFCFSQHPEPWQAPTPALRELRALVARCDALDAMRTQEKNRLLVARESVRKGIEAHLDYLEKPSARSTQPSAARSTMIPISRGSGNCSRASPDWVRKPSLCCCRTTAGRRALTMHVKPPPSRASTRVSRSREAA